MMIGCVSRPPRRAGAVVSLVFAMAVIPSARATPGCEFPKTVETDQGAASPSVPSLPNLPSGGAPVAADRQVSWKRLAPNVLSDQKPIWLFPVHVAQGRHWKPALGFVLGTAALVALDPHDSSYFR